MANTVVRGQHNIGNFPSNTGLNVIDGRIQRLIGPGAPTMAMVGTDSEIPMEETDDKFRWRTEDPQVNYLTANGSHASSLETLTVDEIDLAQEGQYLYNPATGEEMRISGLDSSTNTATLERSVGSVAAATIADNQRLLLMPQALKPRETPGETPTVYGEFRQNYFAQFGWKMSQDYWSSAKPSYMLEPEDKVRLYEAQQKFLKNGPLQRQMEVAIWYGTGQAMTENQRGFFKGIKSFITTYTTTSAGDLTYNAIFDHINSINNDRGIVAGQNGLRTFRLYGNEVMLGIFNAVARTYATTHRSEGAVIAPNLKVSRFETDFGTLEFMVIPQLADGELYGVDFSDVSFKPMAVKHGPNAGLFIEFERDHVNTGALYSEWYYYFRGSIKVGHPNNHFYITGINTTTSAYPNYVGPTSSYIGG